MKSNQYDVHTSTISCAASSRVSVVKESRMFFSKLVTRVSTEVDICDRGKRQWKEEKQSDKEREANEIEKRWCEK